MQKEKSEFKVSIITVAYNSVKTIEQTILSVLNQSYSNIEYIIIDGGSRDGTVNIIKKYSEKISYWISETDKGIYDAMNKGLDVASGDVIGIINSDDWYETNAVEVIVQYFKNNSELEGVCGDLLIHLDFNKYNMIKVAHSSINLSNIREKMSIAHPTLFLKKSFYLTYGNFDPKYSIAADYELLLRAMLKGAKLGYIPFLIAHFRVGGASSNQLKLLRDVIKIKKIHNNSLKSIMFFCVQGYCAYIYMRIQSVFPSGLLLFIKRVRGWKLVNK